MMRGPSDTAPEASPGDPGSSRRAPLLGFPYVVSVLAAPGRTFRDLAARPQGAWIGPVILCAVLTTLATWIMLPEILDLSYTSAVALMDKLGVPEAGREETLAAMPLESTPRVILTQVAPNLLIVPVFILLGAAFVHFVSRLFGAHSAFGPTLGMFAVGYVVWALGSVVHAAVAAVSDSLEVTLGPGALLPGVPVLSPAGIFLDLFDVFSMWHLFVLAAGTAVVTRASRGTAWGVALAFWVIRSLFLAGGKVFMLWAQGG